MNILVADNYPLSRIGMSQLLLMNFPKYKVIATEKSQDVFKKLQKSRFDLVIWSISNPGQNAMNDLTKLKSLYQKTPVLIICIYPETVYGFRAIKNGASGYLSRENSTSEFLVAVKKVLSGGIYLSSGLAENIAGKFSKNYNKPGHEVLSDRELQVLQLMAGGKTAKQISTETALSANTISTYRSRILTKLELKTNAQLTRYAIENDLV